MNEADCVVYVAREIVFSQWPDTDIVIPVTFLLQCPDDDAPSASILRQTLPYVLRHAWQFWVLRSLLFGVEG